MAAENVEVKIPEETLADDGLVVIKLKKPLDYNGVKYEEIKMDLENLTGRDSMEVENEIMMKKKGAVVFGALNNDYILGIASKACAKAQQPLGTDAFLALSLKDHNRVKDAVRNFLLK